MKPTYKNIFYLPVFFIIYSFLSYGGMKLERYLKVNYITGIFYELYAMLSSIIIGVLFSCILIGYIKTKANFKTYLISAITLFVIALLSFSTMLQGIPMVFVMFSQFNTLIMALSFVMLILGIWKCKKA